MRESLSLHEIIDGLEYAGYRYMIDEERPHRIIVSWM